MNTSNSFSSTSITRPSGFGLVRATEPPSDSDGAMGSCVRAYSDEWVSMNSSSFSYVLSPEYWVGWPSLYSIICGSGISFTLGMMFNQFTELDSITIT